MPLDNRVRFVLVALDRKTEDAPACMIVSPNDAPTNVVASALRSAKALGYAECYMGKHSTRLWQITDEGRAAIRQSH